MSQATANTEAEREAFLNWEDPAGEPEEGSLAWAIGREVKRKMERCNHEESRIEEQAFANTETAELVTVEICNKCGATKLPEGEYEI